MPEDERAMWAALTTEQRARAMQRMTSLERWAASDSELDVKQAAADAGVSVTRMYEMGKAWRDKRSLTSLGTFAAAPKTRVAKHDAAIRSVLGGVIDADRSGSVRKLAMDLEVAVRDLVAELPSYNTLRRYVERELRRREREAAAGNDLMLDCSACVLTPSDPAVLTVFVILDRATQVIAGAALGDVGDSRGGFARAASDAARRFEAGQFSTLHWVDRMERCEIVVGTDVGAWPTFVSQLSSAGFSANVSISTAKDRFGRYLRPATRLRIGTVVLMPKYTVAQAAPSRLERAVAPSEHQDARLSVEVDEYNAEIITGMDGGSNLRPPDDVPLLLRMLARLSA